MGVIGGLLLKHPLFYDNYETGVLYREFASYADIRKTETILNEIIAFDDLLAFIPVAVDSISSGVFMVIAMASICPEVSG